MAEGYWRSPRSDRFDWLTGGVCSGLTLALVELLLIAPTVHLPEALALALALACTGLVVAATGLLWLVTRQRGAQYSRSALVGAMLGPITAVALCGPVVRALGLRGSPWELPASLLFGVVTLLLVSRAGLVIASREGPGRRAEPILVWSGAALLGAGCARLAHDGLGAGMPSVGAVLAGPVLMAGGLLTFRRGQRMGALAGFGRLLWGLVPVTAAAAFWQLWLPWLLYDGDLPDVGPWPPNFVVTILDAPESSPDEGLPALELLAATGLTYANLTPPAVDALLALPDGRGVAQAFAELGYATGAVIGRPSNAAALGFGESDAYPGGRRLLESEAAWMSGAGLLRSPALPLLSLVDEDRALRSPRQLGGDAAHWILRWRTLRAPAPFFLLADLRTGPASGADLDAGLQAVLDRLEELQLGHVTILLVAVSGGASPSASDLRLVFSPPFTWPHSELRRVSRRIPAALLSAALLEIARSDAGAPIELPGLREPLSPPQR
jgi:hypothetical protein